MRRSASTAPLCRTNVNALLLIGSILLVGLGCNPHEDWAGCISLGNSGITHPDAGAQCLRRLRFHWINSVFQGSGINRHTGTGQRRLLSSARSCKWSISRNRGGGFVRTTTLVRKAPAARLILQPYRLCVSNIIDVVDPPPSSSLNAGFPSESSCTFNETGVRLVRTTKTCTTPLLCLIKSVTRKSTEPGTL
jgi:hypothetical protein